MKTLGFRRYATNGTSDTGPGPTLSKKNSHTSSHSSDAVMVDANGEIVVPDPGDVESIHFVPVDEVPRCFACHSQFWFFAKRRNCYRCGGVFCKQCSTNSVLVRVRGKLVPHHTCADCFDKQHPPFLDDRKVLLGLYACLNGPGWVREWTPSPRDWEGVVWEANRVVGLHLQKFGLKGKIPDFIGLLTCLREFHLSYNSISGPIPTTIGQLTNLVSLDLSYNRLSGQVPSTLVSCAHLHTLHLSGNLQLGGTLPTPIIRRLSSGSLHIAVEETQITAFVVGVERDSRSASERGEEKRGEEKRGWLSTFRTGDKRVEPTAQRAVAEEFNRARAMSRISGTDALKYLEDGTRCIFGMGTTIDFALGIYHLKAAAVQGGDCAAAAMLGYLHFPRDMVTMGVPSDLDLAREWCVKAMEMGLEERANHKTEYTPSQHLLGWIIGCPELSIDHSPALSVHWLSMAATQGYAPAQYDLAVSLRSHLGEGLDEALELDLLSHAAQAGHAIAQCALGEVLRQRQDHKGAQKWIAVSASQAFARAQHLLGELGKREEKQLWLERSAAQGYAPAQFSLFLHHVSRSAEPTALSYLKAAATGGLAEAQFHYGKCLVGGLWGSTKDEAEGWRWVLLAANQGHVGAAHFMQ